MPLTPFQLKIAKLISKNRTEESHLAGGAALHKLPHSIRYSEDLDYFHDSEEVVSNAFKKDIELIKNEGIQYQVEISQPGYIRIIVRDNKMATKIEWATDSAWRFMPAQKDDVVGYCLHPIDLAINKLLALVGRDEPRDFLDVLNNHQIMLPLGAQIWAACGKDPGFTPESLLELLKRRGKNRQEDFNRLHLTNPVDVKVLKKEWLDAVESAKHFIKLPNAEVLGCLFYSKATEQFIAPTFAADEKDIFPHFGRLGGVVPVIREADG